MGRTLTAAADQSDNIELVAAFERPDHDSIGQDVGSLAGLGPNGVLVSVCSADALAGVDCLIDFTIAPAALATIELCRQQGVGIVLGTTGFDAAGLAAIKTAAESIPIMMAPNMSVGVNVLFKLTEIAARIFGDDVDVEVSEAHHRGKVDAPSGTAMRLGEVLADQLGRDLATDGVHGREGVNNARTDSEIGFQVVRGGDIVGEHTVYFIGMGERVELTHRAGSRMNFAMGAMRATRWLADKTSGQFDMQDVLGLDKY